MHTENATEIRGSIDRIFELAANIQNWPSLLPHYRFVDVLEQSSDTRRKVVRMSAVRDNFPIPGFRFPVTWRSIQICEPDAHRISFKHTAGLATGMWVVWNMSADKTGMVHVTIGHDLRYPLTVLNGWFARSLVGQTFVGAIAGLTLATIKKVVEGDMT